jgi:hypothetical protein
MRVYWADQIVESIMSTRGNWRGEGLTDFAESDRRELLKAEEYANLIEPDEWAMSD